MSEQTHDTMSTADVMAALHELARQVRATRTLSPEAQQALADLVDELVHSQHAAPLPEPEAVHLAESAAQLAQALQQPHESGLLKTAVQRLENVAARMEARAPVVTGVVRRLLAALADLGI
jgi:hypothetical protein